MNCFIHTFISQHISFYVVTRKRVTQEELRIHIDNSKKLPILYKKFPIEEFPAEFFLEVFDNKTLKQKSLRFQSDISYTRCLATLF